MPESFGKFNNNFTLLNTVCSDCNTFFANKLELFLGRDSYEGYIERKLHMPPQDKKNPFTRKKLKLMNGEGLLKGLHIEIVDMYTEKMNIKALPQLALQKRDGGWNYFLLHELHKIEKTDYLLSGNCLKAYGMDEHSAKIEFSKLQIQFERKGAEESPPDGNLLLELQGIIDPIHLRAISKIAFNYFAYFNNDKPLLLTNCFDDIRNYILSGAPRLDIKIDNEAILRDERGKRYRRRGHVITIERKLDNIVVQISLFNGSRYTVPITTDLPKGIVASTDFGHFFDFINKNIIEVRKKGLIIIPHIWTP